MGFFSSRKPDLTDGHSHDKSVSQVLRSRFYGNDKGKARDLKSPRNHASISQSPLAHNFDSNSRTPTSSLQTRPDSITSPAVSGRSATTDPITMTLAQRLNELAAANADGLLDDEEYRLLRQNLFERLASSSQVPSEAPLVPLVAPNVTGVSGRTSMSSNVSRPASNFHVSLPRTASIQSSNSVKSTMSAIIRRATGRRSGSTFRNGSDASSIYSADSRASSVFQRPIARQSSDSSLRTDSSRLQSLSSRVAGTSRADVYERSLSSSTSISRNTSRSGKGIGTTPPSSFSSRLGGVGVYAIPQEGIEGLAEEDHLNTAKAIRKEIELVEAEGRRLLDAFNGLELTTLTRQQRRSDHRPMLPVPIPDDGRTLGTASSTLSAGHHYQSTKQKDGDTISVRSKFSFRATPSSVTPITGVRDGKAHPPIPGVPTLSRKSSLSSVSSRGRGRSGSSSVPTFVFPAPSGVQIVSHTTVHSRSDDVNGRAPGATDRSLLPRAGVVRGEDLSAELSTLEADMTDIRRRRAEVTNRYERRLDYLRAKLKGAEIHEKLMR